MPVSPADAVLVHASAYIGNHEEPMGSNDGSFVRECFKHTWLKFKAIPKGKAYWCVAFVQRVFDECGLSWPWKTAGAYDFGDRGTQAGWAHKLPKPADVAVWNIGDGHASIVRSYDAKTGLVTTIDGNVSDRVMLCTRPIAEARCFIRHPSLHSKPKPAPAPPKPPLWEVLTSQSGKSVVVYRNRRSKVLAWLGKQSSWAKRFPGGIRIRRAA
ncbi:MAG: CHAP domain-containing protein [Solirubrobacterales bacterium]|nr:CHAP domain-containing protein [Solirubrobacterales bacterium]